MKLVRPVETARELKAFIDFPHDLYRGDKNYVPELYLAQHDLLKPGKHPFYHHSKLQLFLAYNGSEIIGRIAAIRNNNHNAYNQANDGFFGFFDCVNDQETADLLLHTAVNWLRTEGFTSIIGPVNFSTNETCGLLIEGYDRAPMAMMPYNAAYYLPLLEGTGLKKKIDLLAYYVSTDSADDRSVRLLEVLQERLKRNGIVIRSINTKKFNEEVDKVRAVYNKAWDKNLGFVPMTNDEFRFMAKDLKMILNPDFCLVAEKDGEFIGFALGIPNINQILKNIRRGRLLPTGIFKLLFGLKKINELRVLTLGVNDGYRKLGIEACLYGTIIKNARKSNIIGAECSWMLEDNFLMNHAIEQLGGKLYKKYRLLEKSI